MLSLRELGFAYDAGRHVVFERFSAEIGPGVTWIVGDDGSGKTTLLKLIAGELTGRGTIRIAGAPSAVAWCDPRDESADALAVAAFIECLRAKSPFFDDAALQGHIAGFGLEPHLDKAMFQLSTGTRRKVGLAATLAMTAPVTLLDDPGAALDAPSVAYLMERLAERDGDVARACLVSAWEAPPEAVADRVLTLPPRR